MKFRTLIRSAARREAAHLGDAARQAADTLRRDPRVQDTASRLKSRAQDLGGAARSQADLHLERLIERAHTHSGDPVPDDVAALLESRRREREARVAGARARAALLALAENTEQRRLLTLVAQATPWAGGQTQALRYTGLLDRLAPSGDAGAEMAVHRALWTLAERRVLSVSPHGVVTACPLEAPPEV
jgi:hypothetical protein